MALGHNDLKKRVKILIDGDPHVIVESDFVKPGKGQAFTKVKVRNMLNGKIFEKTYKSNESAEETSVNFSSMDYLYNDGTMFSFMDMETFEQYEVEKSVLAGADKFLLENTKCEIAMWEGRIIEVTPPNFMVLQVVEAPPGLKGDTAGGKVLRPAKLETGAEVQIPLFVEEGEKIKVDTRTGEYVERAK